MYHLCMEVIDYVFLGFVQGFAEWLPVSSEGVVTLLSRLLYGQSLAPSLGIAIWLHVGTLAAAAAYLRSDVLDAVKPVLGLGGRRGLSLFVLTATASSAATAVPLLMFLEEFSVSDGFFTIFVGACLLAVAFLQSISRRSEGSELRLSVAAVVGLVQGFSVIPGVSRSGVTITALLYFGFSLDRALRLSYLLSIPAVAGAQVLVPILLGTNFLDWGMAAGTLTAAAVGYLTIKTLLRLATSRSSRLLTLSLALSLVLIGAAMEVLNV